MSDVEVGAFEGITNDLPEFFVPKGIEQHEIYIDGGNLISVGGKLLELSGLQVIYFDYLIENIRLSPNFHGLPIHPEIANNARAQINAAAEREAVRVRNFPRKPMAHYLSAGTVVIDRREEDSTRDIPTVNSSVITAEKDKVVEAKGVAIHSKPSTENGTRKPKRDGGRSSGRGGLREMIVAHVHSAEPNGINWQDKGNCLNVDPDLFFPERGASTREAKSVCANCGVRSECLEYALVNGEKFGIWGGMSERERRRLRRQRAVARRAAAEAAAAGIPRTD